jgi:hypothetical protein
MTHENGLYSEEAGESTRGFLLSTGRQIYLQGFARKRTKSVIFACTLSMRWLNIASNSILLLPVLETLTNRDSCRECGREVVDLRGSLAVDQH